MAKRPYLSNSIIELEAIFAENPDNRSKQKALLNELKIRSTSRAARLQRKILAVQEVLSAPPVKETKTSKPKPKPKPKLDLAPEFEFVSQPQPEDIPYTNYENPFVETLQKVKTSHQTPLPKPPITNDTENILSAWTALEVLSPQGYKREADLAGGAKYKIASLSNGQLPWEAGERSRPKKRLYYELILGTINLEPAVEALLKVFADKRPDTPKVRRRSPIASILLDKEGRPLDEDNSFAISSFAWGVPIALKGNLRELANWSHAEKALVNKFRTLLQERDRNGDIKPLTKSKINELYGNLVVQLDLKGQDIAPPHFAIRRYEFFASKVPPEPGLLNSFYLEDLSLARSLCKGGSLPKALKYYLGVTKPKERIDLLEDTNGLSNLLQPALTPNGKWPAPGHFPLALLQQAAVNATTTGLEETGVFSVNGPPGTGKTTLLRDVVSARIVERALIMLKYNNPTQAFTATRQSMQRGGAKVTLQKLDDRLKGFEMVVASSNNKAVENVSAELPELNAIDSSETELRYFPSISDNVLKSDSWGIFAAVLGNASNRFKFSQDFWRDEERGLSTYLNHLCGVPQIVTEPQENGPPIKRLREVIIHENPPKNKTEINKNWISAKTTFIEEFNKAEQVKEDRQKLFKLMKLQTALGTKMSETAREIPSHENSVVEANVKVDICKANLEAARKSVIATEKRCEEHNSNKPGFFVRLFNTKKAREWKTAHNYFLNELKNAKSQVGSHTTVYNSEFYHLEKIEDELEKIKGVLVELETKYSHVKKVIAENVSKIDASIPIANFFDGPREKVQCSNLWFTKADNEQRNKVFEAAIALHKAFIDGAADPLRQNLAIFTETFGTRSFGTQQKDELIGDLWSTFFLVVPVVSTTFASVNRMFSKLPYATLGWLLVDEAGQSVPQAAVGAIMRSKRAVVVGDPLQIEPVVTLSSTLTEEICGYFGIEALSYNAPAASVQTLADAASPYCARFPIASGYRDVGAPLLVHRRCDSPMFEISNEIAYSNLMVQAKKSTNTKPVLGQSCWFDVAGKFGPDKWCSDEATKLIKLLTKLRDNGIPADIYIVTPFVIVQNNLRIRLKESGLLEGWVKTPHKWLNEHVGTVHTVQGREADIVFFVLGAQSPSQSGARNWAGGMPNLPNVAVTRAKSFLYVIGNRSLWKSAGHFAVLDRLLPKAD